MAWLYLSRRPFAEALDRIRRGIRKLNDRIGQPAATHRAPDSFGVTGPKNGDPNGYHETITVALTRIIAGRLRPGEDFDAFRDRQPGPLRPQAAGALPVLLASFSGPRRRAAIRGAGHPGDVDRISSNQTQSATCTAPTWHSDR